MTKFDVLKLIVSVGFFLFVVIGITWTIIKTNRETKRQNQIYANTPKVCAEALRKDKPEITQDMIVMCSKDSSFDCLCRYWKETRTIEGWKGTATYKENETIPVGNPEIIMFNLLPVNTQ